MHRQELLLTGLRMAESSNQVSVDRAQPVMPPPPPKWSWRVWSVWAVALEVLFVAPQIINHEDGFRDEWPLFIVGGPLGATMYYGIYFWMKRLMFRFVDRQLQTRNLTIKTESLQEDLDKDFFTNVVRINFKYLDKYYLQTQEQGDKSFLLCLAASVGGLAIVIAGVVMMFLNKTSPAYLTAAAGVLSEFVAAVFFYLYNKTVLSMGDYHQKLVITQNIALALKITGDLPPEERTKAHIGLVDALTKDVNHLLVGGPTSKERP